MKTPIIADSSGLVSLVSSTDKNHQAALQYSKKLSRTFGSMIIPTEIFAETLNVLGKKISHQTAVTIGLELIASKTFVIADSSSQLRSSALNKFSNQKESVSFTDCIVMAFADQLDTKEVFGFDKIFSKNGYEIA